MTRRTALVAGPASLLLAVAVLTAPAGASAPPALAAPQHACSGAFCVDFDLLTMDAQAPAQATTAAGQPTNLQLRFTDTSAAVATDKTTWLAKVSAVLGTSSTKAIALTDPATLPLGAYVAGSAATAGSCCPGSTAPATPLPARPGPAAVTSRSTVMPVQRDQACDVRHHAASQRDPGGALTANISVFIPPVTPLGPLTTTAPITYSRRDRERRPALTLDVRATPDAGGAGPESDFSMNTSPSISTAWSPRRRPGP